MTTHNFQEPDKRVTVTSQTYVNGYGRFAFVNTCSPLRKWSLNKK